MTPAMHNRSRSFGRQKIIPEEQADTELQGSSSKQSNQNLAVETIAEHSKKQPIFSLIACTVLALSFFTPYFLLTLPLMVASGLLIFAIFRKEKPKALPYIIGGAALIMFSILYSGSFTGIKRDSTPVPNAVLYKNATWEYGSSTDAMRGTISKYATLDSPTDLNLDSPYDGNNKADIMIGNDESILLSASKGQITCNSQDTIAVKFDNGSVNEYPCTELSGLDHPLVSINYGKSSFHHDERIEGVEKLLDALAKAKTMTIEVSFYGSGARQLVFNVSGLDKSKL